MPRRIEEGGGPAYYRLYCAAERCPTEVEFATICESSGLARPSGRMFSHIRRLFDARKPPYVPMNTLDVELKGRGESWSLDRLTALVEASRRERADLEFKRSADSKDKDSQTKRVWAAMANSGGGTVVDAWKRRTPSPRDSLRSSCAALKSDLRWRTSGSTRRRT